jgi:hypothetical protein
MSADAFGPVRRIIWGEGSHIASGAHVWESVAHNLATCPSGTTSTTTTLASATTSTTPSARPTAVTTSRRAR